MGRPTKYSEEMNNKAEEYASQGLSNDQIANNLGIDRATLYEWQKEYSDFSDAIKRGKEKIDLEVENKMLELIRGFDYSETTQELKKNKKGEFEVVTIKKTNKKSLPNYKAMEFWLRNRQPQKWNNTEQTQEIQAPIFNIQVTDNSKLKKKFEEYETNT